MFPLRKYVCTEYCANMKVLNTKTTDSIEEAKEWLNTWAEEQNEKYCFEKKIHVNYENLYAEVVGECSLIKIIVKKSAEIVN